MKYNKIIEEVTNSDISLMKETWNEIDKDVFEHAVDTILKAKRIYIIGIRNSAPLADMLAMHLNLICENVIRIQTSGSREVFEQMMHINEKDVVIGISFPRYSLRTIKALEFANSRQAKIITLTDSVNSPLNLYSSCNLIAKSNLSPMMESMIAPVSVINGLVMSLYIKKKKKVVDSLTELEGIWDEYQIYDREELNSFAYNIESE